jgi:hypothetical protein
MTRGQRDGSPGRIFGFLDRSRYFSIKYLPVVLTRIRKGVLTQFDPLEVSTIGHISKKVK